MSNAVELIIIIIISVDDATYVGQMKLTYHSCGLATAVSNGEICSRNVFLSYDGKRLEISRQLVDMEDGRRIITESPTCKRRPWVLGKKNCICFVPFWFNDNAYSNWMNERYLLYSNEVDKLLILIKFDNNTCTFDFFF